MIRVWLTGRNLAGRATLMIEDDAGRREHILPTAAESAELIIRFAEGAVSIDAPGLEVVEAPVLIIEEEFRCRPWPGGNLGTYDVRILGDLMVISEVEHNGGPSVTNAIEMIAPEAAAKLGQRPLLEYRVFERYPKGMDGRKKDTVDRVDFRKSGTTSHGIRWGVGWHPARPEEVEEVSQIFR